jgi:hypothetical protein
VAVPCAGHRHDAAAETRRRLQEERAARRLLHKNGTAAGWEGFLRLGYGGLISIAGSTREKGGGSGAHR